MLKSMSRGFTYPWFPLCRTFTGYPDEPGTDAFEACVVHDDLEQAGDFICLRRTPPSHSRQLPLGHSRQTTAAFPPTAPARRSAQGGCGDRAAGCRARPMPTVRCGRLLRKVASLTWPTPNTVQWERCPTCAPPIGRCTTTTSPGPEPSRCVPNLLCGSNMAMSGLLHGIIRAIERRRGPSHAPRLIGPADRVGTGRGRPQCLRSTRLCDWVRCRRRI